MDRAIVLNEAGREVLVGLSEDETVYMDCMRRYGLNKRLWTGARPDQAERKSFLQARYGAPKWPLTQGGRALEIQKVTGNLSPSRRPKIRRVQASFSQKLLKERLREALDFQHQLNDLANVLRRPIEATTRTSDTSDRTSKFHRNSQWRLIGRGIASCCFGGVPEVADR